MGLTDQALKAIASRYYLPHGCGIDRDDLVQEATIAAASVEGKGNGYARRTVHNAIGMLIERERAQKRLPPDGYRSMPEEIASTHGHVRGVSVNSDETTATVPRITIPAPDRTAEEEVYVREVLDALTPTARKVITLRLDPRAMLAYYEQADRPVPQVASYADIAKHLDVSVAAVMRAIDEARRLVLTDA